MLKRLPRRDSPRRIQAHHLRDDIPEGFIDVLPHGEGSPRISLCELRDHSQDEVAPLGNRVIEVLQEADQPRTICEVGEQTLYDDSLLLRSA